MYSVEKQWPIILYSGEGLRKWRIHFLNLKLAGKVPSACVINLKYLTSMGAKILATDKLIDVIVSSIANASRIKCLRRGRRDLLV